MRRTAGGGSSQGQGRVGGLGKQGPEGGVTGLQLTGRGGPARDCFWAELQFQERGTERLAWGLRDAGGPTSSFSLWSRGAAVAFLRLFSSPDGTLHAAFWPLAHSAS